jgi:HEAT repeat protein
MNLGDREQALRAVDDVIEGRTDLDKARSVLLVALDHPAVDVRIRAAAAGWHLFDDATVVDRLSRIAASDEDTAVRALCLSALGRVVVEGVGAGLHLPEGGGTVDPEMIGDGFARQYRTVRDLLFRRLEDGTEDMEVRRRALESLGYLPVREVSGWIERFASHARPEARAGAAYAMGVSGDAGWADALTVLFDDPAVEVRIDAIEAAGRLRIEALRDRITGSCLDPDPGIARAAAESIADMLPLEEGYVFVRDLVERASPAAREDLLRLAEDLAYELLVPPEEYDDNGHDSEENIL